MQALQSAMMGSPGSARLDKQPSSQRAEWESTDLGRLVACVVVSHADVDGAIAGIDGVEGQVGGLGPQRCIVGHCDGALREKTACQRA